MRSGRLSPHRRMADRLGRDPGAAIRDMVYREGLTLKDAGLRLGVSVSTAQRWLRDYEAIRVPAEISAQ